LVIEIASQQTVTLKDFWIHELAIDMQTRLLELSKFQPISSLRDENAKKFCHFHIREGAELNSATQNVIGYALERLLDTTQGGNDDVSK
jgi:hypothetical protein